MVVTDVNNSGVEKETSDMEEERMSKELLMLQQEVKIVQALASNSLEKRNKQMKNLRRWLSLRSESSFPFAEEDFLRIWKGLYYNMWLSDKPLIQEELAEKMGRLLDCFPEAKKSVEFFGAFLKTISREWFGIDQWRIDKFLMLVRRMLRHMFVVLKATNWNVEDVDGFNFVILQSGLHETTSSGLIMHILDIFFEELAKVSDGKMNAQQVWLFVKPFVVFMSKPHDFKLIAHCRSRVFCHLLYQSKLGREYTEKYNAWKAMGFPTASIHELEKVDSESEVEEPNDDVEANKVQHLDPRAGNVNVFMPELPLDVRCVIDELEALLQTNLHTKRRKVLRKLLQMFTTYERGVFPLGTKRIQRTHKGPKPKIKESVVALNDFEKDIFVSRRALKQLNKRQRKKLLKSLNHAEMTEDNFDSVITKAVEKRMTAERKKTGSSLGDWIEEEIAAPLPLENVDVEESTLEESLAINEEINMEDNDEIELGKAVNCSQPENKKKEKKSKTTSNPAEEEQNDEQTMSEMESIMASVITPEESPTLVDEAKKALNEWDDAKAPGEIEYFIPSRKYQLKGKLNRSPIVRNPFWKGDLDSSATRTNKKSFSKVTPEESPAGSAKRVKIALMHNTEQKPSEYIKQIKSSPNLPYDATKKPTKSLLKPNQLPSPINPFYKKRLGLNFPRSKF